MPSNKFCLLPLWLTLAGAMLLLVFLAPTWGQEAPTPPSTQHALELRRYALFEPELTCEQAHRLSHRVLERLGFKITFSQPAPPGGTGILQGSREEHLGPERVTVKITCKDEGVYVDSESDLPPCEQANRVSYRAVERLGFTVTAFVPASEGGSGMVKGVREGSRGREQVALTITCGADAIYIDTSSEKNPLLDSEDFYLAIGDFRRGFYALFRGMALDMRLRKTYPASAPPPDQVQVVIRPLPQSEAPWQPSAGAASVFPVRVEIFNTTSHTYLLNTKKIVLLTSSGERVQPISPSQKELLAHMLSSQTLPPETTVRGYLYYPSGSYTGARGFVVEKDSQEREGFAINF